MRGDKVKYLLSCHAPAVRSCYNLSMYTFNIAGPCDPKRHYMLPATSRLEMETIQRLINTQNYFVLHAPRQTGKTTAMLELARQLTESGRFVAALVSTEVGAGFPDDVDAAEQAILNSWRASIEKQLPNEPSLDWGDAPAGRRTGSALEKWSKSSQHEVVILIDEIDALQNDVLISMLRQLRDGHRNRPRNFPASVALIGLRDVRDYKVMSGGSERLGTSSPFNVSARSFTLRNFTQDEVKMLLLQHTSDTGQQFTAPALQIVFELTQGQPWLVNALAFVSVEELVQDRLQPITDDTIVDAKEILIQRRQTHIDQLTDKLREPRLRRVIAPILSGGVLTNVSEDDRDYALDLGLVRREPGGGLVIANPIYNEVIPRSLTGSIQDSMPAIYPAWLTPTGRLDAQQLLEAFLEFWQLNGQPLLQSAPYHEIAPHLVMMAFLHRVVNGHGVLHREFAIGTDKLDLFLQYGEVEIAIELKVWRQGRPDPIRQGLLQLERYMSRRNAVIGWLVIFDQRADLPDISERIRVEAAQTPTGRNVKVVRA